MLNFHQNQCFTVPPELTNWSQVNAKTSQWTEHILFLHLAHAKLHALNFWGQAGCKTHCVSEHTISLQWKGAPICCSQGWWKWDGDHRHAVFLILVIWLRCSDSLYSQKKGISCSLWHPELPSQGLANYRGSPSSWITQQKFVSKHSLPRGKPHIKSHSNKFWTMKDEGKVDAALHTAERNAPLGSSSLSSQGQTGAALQKQVW